MEIKMKKILFFIFISSFFTFCQNNEEYKVEKIAEGFRFTEGPVWMNGKLLFSDIPENKVYQWTEEKGTEIFLDPSGNSNGLALDAEGNLLLAQHGKRRVARIVNEIEIALADSFAGKKLNSPNDMTIKSDGTIYFTDPPYGIDAEEEELGFYGIYKLSTDGELLLLDSTLVRPNGLAFSPDEKLLYVADSQERKVFVFDVDEDGKISNKKLFVDMTSDKKGTADGMKMGKDGLLYSTGPGGIWIIDDKGLVIRTIDVPGQTTNCNWGPEGNILYITSGDAVYRLRIK
jgi:gluconolactonase